jgi:pimeloyl-ACP methyl ester carboxylesterase
MSSKAILEKSRRFSAADARRQLLTGVPVTERRLDLDGISTAVLEGGSGSPLVLLHGPGEHAVKWIEVIPALVEGYRVIAPDLPGHGSTEPAKGESIEENVFRWLEALIDQTCPEPPTLVGQVIGGAIAARFAADHGQRLARLVLVDTLGLAPFQPAPKFGRALHAFVVQPNQLTYDELWRQCAFDLDLVRDRMGERWEVLKAYSLDRVTAPGAQAAQGALMELFGFPPIPEAVLARIAVPTTLIWGRHDLATSLAVAEAASTRYGWPLYVIEDAADDPATDQPGRFAEALARVTR